MDACFAMDTMHLLAREILFMICYNSWISFDALIGIDLSRLFVECKPLCAEVMHVPTELEVQSSSPLPDASIENLPTALYES